MPASFQRRILHHGPTPFGTPLLLSDRAVSGCWFELHRRGGCGAGELVLRDDFPERKAIEVGDWISCEAAPNDRWYLGRVEELQSNSPAEVRLRLEGMSIELTEVFPGGFASDVDGAPPHRFAATDQFPNDPDWSLETVDSLMSAEELVRKLIEYYVAPATHIEFVPARIETPRHPAPLSSLKFRGEESIASIIKELGLRAQAAWGVDAHGQFFFLQSRTTPLASWREGRDVTALSEIRDREHLFNRVLLTGDYVYDHRDATYDIARRSYRWRGNYTQPDSRLVYGDRRIRLWIPWLRTDVDSLAFVREFFRIYSVPTARFSITTLPQMTIPFPWEGRVRLEDRNGEPLFIGMIETVRILFDHAPRLKLELGPEDPRNLWPEPPHDERWELPAGPPPGGPVSMTTQPSASSEFTLETTTVTSTGGTSDDSVTGLTGENSESRSGDSSEASSDFGSADASTFPPDSSDDSSNSSPEVSTGASSQVSSAGSDRSSSTVSDVPSSFDLSGDLSGASSAFVSIGTSPNSSDSSGLSSIGPTSSLVSEPDSSIVSSGNSLRNSSSSVPSESVTSSGVTSLEAGTSMPNSSGGLLSSGSFAWPHSSARSPDTSNSSLADSSGSPSASSWNSTYQISSPVNSMSTTPLPPQSTSSDIDRSDLSSQPPSNPNTSIVESSFRTSSNRS
ncbi:MAG: hypothetical protein ACK5Q5_20005 [Planctomycetaceae bacterium]